MPRRIDTDARSLAIAGASLRVLERDGLAGLSVRGVADEAGIATASLRRAFPTQHSLREHCFSLIQQRASARIRTLTLTGRATRWLAVFADMGASLLVVANGLRLLRK